MSPIKASVLALLLALAIATLAPSCGTQDQRPNVLLLLTDDLGYGDLSMYGSTEIDTPHIDSIAADGVRFSSAYASAPICAPMRAGLITGRYQQRFGYVYWTGTYQSQIQKDRGVPVSEVFISDVLKDAGYRTGFIGKWHLGVNERFRPHNRGFDEWFGFLPGLHDYFDWRAPENGGIWRNNEPAEGDTYLTDAFTGEAVDFITRNQDEPFFLYLAYNAVHSPIQVPEHYLQGIESPDPERRKMLGMVRAVDTGVGRILATLDDLKIADNTLVLFANDNGGATLSSNMPFQGSKATMWEGGSRVAMALRWPDQLESGSTFKRVVSTLDLFPTFAAAAGASLPAQRKIDGVDLMPFLTSDKKGQLHPALFWSLGEHGSSRAVREGPWKLVKQDYTLSLHNLIEDPSEQTDLKAQHPEIFTKLQRDWEAWNSEMVPPLWTTR